MSKAVFQKATAIVIEKPRHAAIREIRLPEIDDESIVIRTVYSAISTGTEVKVWNGKTGKLGGELWYPTVPGYEQVGIVEYVGPRACKTATGETLKPGDRVMANEVRRYPDYCASWGGQVSLSVKNPKTSSSPFDMPAKIPDEVSFQEAAACYLGAVAEKGIRKVGLKAGETVLMIGLGAVGLSVVQLARLHGVKLIVVDKSPWRLERAKRFADHALCIDAAHDSLVDAVSGLTNSRMVDVIIDASGDSAVINNLRRLTRDGGWTLEDDGARIHLQGDYPEPVCFTPYQEWFNRNLRISMSCALRPGGKEVLLNLVREGKFDAKALYDKEVELEDAPKEYAELERNRATRMKTLIRWPAV